MNEVWLALVIGNSRWHWAQFSGEKLIKTWHEEREKNLQLKIDFPLYLASVIPEYKQELQNISQVKIIQLEDIPLKGMYATLGIDRALALWGAGIIYGFPCLVIDGGTALTLTGADENFQLIGGAIMPGLRLQLQSLAQKTAALPEINLPTNLPSRWALETKEAIASGVIYSVLGGVESFLHNWWEKFPQSKVVFTGGDGKIIYGYLQQGLSQIEGKIIFDPHLIFLPIAQLYLKDRCGI